MLNQNDPRKTNGKDNNFEDDLIIFDNVVSSNDCTGLMPTPPIDEYEEASYSDLYTVPKKIGADLQPDKTIDEE